MGKTLFELINDKKAISDLASQQAGNKVQPTPAPQSSTLLGAANTFVQNVTGVNAKELLVKYVGKQPIDRLRVEANFLEKFPAIALKEYGLDAPRILLQRDPHANKKAIQRASGVVGKTIGLVPGIGKVLKTGVDKVTNSLLKPLYPDDWLEDPDSNNPKFLYYNQLYKHTINNSKGAIGNFLTGNRTLGQLKENAIPTGLAAASGLAFGALKTVSNLFGGKTTKIRKAKVGLNNNIKGKHFEPVFPSAFVINTTLDDNEVIYYGGTQQLREPGFPKVGEPMYTQSTKAKLESDYDLNDIYESQFKNFSEYSKKYFNKRPKELAAGARGKLTSVYVEQINTDAKDQNTRVSNSSIHLPLKYIPRGYTSNLALRETFDKDTDGVVGIYSKDSLRRWDDNKKAFSRGFLPEDEYDTVYQNYSHQSLHTDYFISQIYANLGGAQVNSNSSLTSKTGTLNKNTGSYWASYKAIGDIAYNDYWIKPVRWNTNTAPYSTAFIDGDLTKNNEILDRDYYFASSSKQSQNKEVSTSTINPYLKQKRDILNNVKDDRIKFKIDGNILLATLTGISDNTTPSWTDVKAVGSGFKFYLYDSWEREISFKFQMYAESDLELALIWEKANKIKALTLPKNGGANGVFGRIVPLVIGDLINEDYGFLTQANISVVDESPWQITEGMQKPFIYEMDITYKVIANSTTPPHYKTQATGSAFTINTKPQTIVDVDLKNFKPAQVDGPYYEIDDIPVEAMDGRNVIDRVNSPVSNPLLITDPNAA